MRGYFYIFSMHLAKGILLIGISPLEIEPIRKMVLSYRRHILIPLNRSFN